MSRLRKSTWVRTDRGLVAMHELTDGLALLPDPYVWHRQQLVFGIPLVLGVLVPGLLAWMALSPEGSKTVALPLLVLAIGAEGALLTASKAAGRRAQGVLWPQVRPMLIVGLLGLRNRPRTVAEVRRNLAIRGFTEPVLRARSIAHAKVLRHGWTIEVTLRTTKGHELTLTRRHPLGQRRFVAILRTVLGTKLDPS